ncbi:hypothetical protein BJ508DRAFT_158027 [Ascobolus immersus RN42]|uniref:Uncharacterized protein n=1 Tax=Ascobolus immersus RN42 TaxID=1160509 RepID=A0A3N4IKI9_ASCIM|nr:hypothetical protein BJ508DRAFT_158027 [Ascobolus immersus RN42]
MAKPIRTVPRSRHTFYAESHSFPRTMQLRGSCGNGNSDESPLTHCAGTDMDSAWACRNMQELAFANRRVVTSNLGEFHFASKRFSLLRGGSGLILAFRESGRCKGGSIFIVITLRIVGKPGRKTMFPKHSGCHVGNKLLGNNLVNDATFPHSHYGQFDCSLAFPTHSRDETFPSRHLQ